MKMTYNPQVTATRYRVQTKSGPRAPWRTLRAFATLNEAMAFAQGLDPDGIITADVRIRAV